MTKQLLKRSVFFLTALVLTVAGSATYVIRDLGLIPRHDYDTLPPLIPAFEGPAVLVLNKTNGFIHKEGIPAADQMLTRIANAEGWHIFISDNAATHEAHILSRFDLVVWNNVSGDVLTAGQREALKTWVDEGGGWVGLHAAGGDQEYAWRWYVETLVGAQFKGHTMSPQFQDADVLVINPELTLSSHLRSPWRVVAEEWYAFSNNPRDSGSEILLTLDESSYRTVGVNWLGMDDQMVGEHPIVWRHGVGRGRALYSAIGHQAATYAMPDYEILIAGAMRWAMDAN